MKGRSFRCAVLRPLFLPFRAGFSPRRICLPDFFSTLLASSTLLREALSKSGPSKGTAFTRRGRPSKGTAFRPSVNARYKAWTLAPEALPPGLIRPSYTRQRGFLFLMVVAVAWRRDVSGCDLGPGTPVKQPHSKIYDPLITCPWLGSTPVPLQKSGSR